MKAVEGQAGIVRAIEIWKEQQVSLYGAEKPQSKTEAELSVLTWDKCTNENLYWERFSHYRRLNQKLLDYFWMESKANEKEYPALARYNGRIGKMTKSIATMDALSRVRSAGTNVSKAMAINEGKKLGLNIANEFTSVTYKKLVELGEDPSLAADIAIEGLRVAKTTNLISDMSRTDVMKEVAGELFDMLNGNPQITARDELYQEVYGDSDALSKNNPNCKNKNKGGDE